MQAIIGIDETMGLKSQLLQQQLNQWTDSSAVYVIDEWIEEYTKLSYGIWASNEDRAVTVTDTDTNAPRRTKVQS